MRSTFNLPIHNHTIFFLAHIVHDVFDFIPAVAKVLRRHFDDRVRNGHISAANQFLVNNMREERFNGCGCTVHREGDGTSRSNHTHLSISISILFSLFHSFHPGFFQCVTKFHMSNILKNTMVHSKWLIVEFFQILVHSACNSCMVSDDTVHIRFVDAVFLKCAHCLCHKSGDMIAFSSNQSHNGCRQCSSFLRIIRNA